MDFSEMHSRKIIGKYIVLHEGDKCMMVLRLKSQTVPQEFSQPYMYYPFIITSFYKRSH